MTVYQVDSEQLALASANATQTGEAVRSSVAAMMAQLQALEASWQGLASSSFQEVLARWHMTQLQVEDSLNAVSTALAQASATYSEAEGSASAMFAG